MQSNVGAGLLANAERQSILLLNDRLHSRPSPLPQGVCDAFGSPQTPNCSRYARTAGKCCLSCGSSSRNCNTWFNDTMLTRSEERRVGKECRSRCDWSSDVCSSDLDAKLLAVRTHRWQMLLELRVIFQELQHLVQRHDAHQIGRASCRERV